MPTWFMDGPYSKLNFKFRRDPYNVYFIKELSLYSSRERNIEVRQSIFKFRICLFFLFYFFLLSYQLKLIREMFFRFRNLDTLRQTSTLQFHLQPHAIKNVLDKVYLKCMLIDRFLSYYRDCGKKFTLTQCLHMIFQSFA